MNLFRRTQLFGALLIGLLASQISVAQNFSQDGSSQGKFVSINEAIVAPWNRTSLNIPVPNIKTSHIALQWRTGTPHIHAVRINGSQPQSPEFRLSQSKPDLAIDLTQQLVVNSIEIDCEAYESQSGDQFALFVFDEGTPNQPGRGFSKTFNAPYNHSGVSPQVEYNINMKTQVVRIGAASSKTYIHKLQLVDMANQVLDLTQFDEFRASASFVPYNVNGKDYSEIVVRLPQPFAVKDLVVDLESYASGGGDSQVTVVLEGNSAPPQLDCPGHKNGEQWSERAQNDITEQVACPFGGQTQTKIFERLQQFSCVKGKVIPGQEYKGNLIDTQGTCNKRSCVASNGTLLNDGQLIFEVSNQQPVSETVTCSFGGNQVNYYNVDIKRVCDDGVLRDAYPIETRRGAFLRSSQGNRPAVCQSAPRNCGSHAHNTSWFDPEGFDVDTNRCEFGNGVVVSTYIKLVEKTCFDGSENRTGRTQRGRLTDTNSRGCRQPNPCGSHAHNTSWWEDVPGQTIPDTQRCDFGGPVVKTYQKQIAKQCWDGTPSLVNNTPPQRGALLKTEGACREAYACNTPVGNVPHGRNWYKNTAEKENVNVRCEFGGTEYDIYPVLEENKCYDGNSSPTGKKTRGERPEGKSTQRCNAPLDCGPDFKHNTSKVEELTPLTGGANNWRDVSPVTCPNGSKGEMIFYKSATFQCYNGRKNIDEKTIKRSRQENTCKP